MSSREKTIIEIDDDDNEDELINYMLENRVLEHALRPLDAGPVFPAASNLCVTCQTKPATNCYILCRHPSVCADCKLSGSPLHCQACLTARGSGGLCPVA